MTDYGKSRYGDAIAEWADRIVGDGFADETAGDVDTIGHYALVTLSWSAIESDDALYRAIVSYELARPLANILGGSRVILRTDSQGFVDVHYGPAHPAGDPAAYAALMREWSAIVDSDAAEDGAE